MGQVVPRPRVAQCPRAREVVLCLAPGGEVWDTALGKGRAYQELGIALPCLAPKTQKTWSPTAPGALRWLGLGVHHRAGGAQGRAHLVWSTAPWGLGLALWGWSKDPQVGDMRVQRAEKAQGGLGVARQAVQMGTFLGAQLQKARWMASRLAGVQPAGKQGRWGCSRGWSWPSPGWLGWISSCSRPRFWRGRDRGAHLPTARQEVFRLSHRPPAGGAFIGGLGLSAGCTGQSLGLGLG